jgi:hypothetical protein
VKCLARGGGGAIVSADFGAHPRAFAQSSTPP